ncbi:ubiquitin carboxyl-terminal hydrolase 10 isoform X2 [Protopterus annectens]|uniref:ubiquitin carboxyl-terminal hydrolase 10 isoform X2 n=1 Tax=Protopterus annectens TaxID=7888 RepID=UPI001CFB8967|nr:ubiquitin carboxyl-terminal hydrolase 10 isoform X2 [Protopterus annectens]
MAFNSNQYIFGEFSPDEFHQFFVSPRCTVELPPVSEKVSCGSQSAGDCQDIQFGADEIELEPTVLNDSVYKISSNLNPQAPEFVLNCQPAEQTCDLSDVDTKYNSLNCQFAEPDLSLDASIPDGPDNDVASGGLAQRERKKKKKRPPGYYSYMDVGGHDAAVSETLVNGHASNVAGLTSLSTEQDFSVELLEPSPTERTCDSPANSVDFINEAASDIHVSNALDDDDDEDDDDEDDDDDRTAEQTQTCRLTHLELYCHPLETGSDSTLRTAVDQPCSNSESTENYGDSNGQMLETSIDFFVDSGVGLLTEEGIDSDQTKLEDAPPTASTTVPHSLTPLTAQPAKSWASLFHTSKSSSGPVAYVESKCTPPPPSPTVVPSEKVPQVKEGPVSVSDDPEAPRIAELLNAVKLIHKPVSLQPRGLINKGNWCYINATLQALVACPPMYHLMKSIPMFEKTERPYTSTPMIDSFVRLMNEFSNMPLPSKPKQQGAADKSIKDIRPGVPFEPTYIYKLLTVIKSSLSEKGRQEDAEEYLGFILNGLHEEMVALKKMLSPPAPKNAVLNGPEPPVSFEDEQDKEEEGSEDEWEQVGPRNRISVTRQADFVPTAITDIFGGHIRSVVYQMSSKESATLQPFFTLQLDIQSEKIRTVQDALESFVARESVQGYTTKTKQEVEISRRVTLEELPPVLVLHLKRFVFEKTGGCQKLTKTIEYPIDLEISKDLLSPGVKSKIFKGQRTYRLFAVVYHHGNSATGGHYTTDVFQIGLNGWLRIDDQTVKVINQYQVVKPSADRTAYLLYYRRVDLL